LARTQAADFEERRAAIVELAARLFAERGFLGASLADLAGACEISKSLIYHYYDSKEDILFDVMHGHVRALLDTAEDISARPIAPSRKLAELTLAFVRLYAGAAARQRVLLNELQRLSKEQRAIVIGIQRRLIEIVENLLAELRPDLEAALRPPAAMLWFGMINWMHTWLHPDGPVPPFRIAELASEIFLKGIEAANIPRTV
jgi:AcrR family transcriptional regulator